MRFDYELFFVVRGRLNNMTTVGCYVVKVENSVLESVHAPIKQLQQGMNYFKKRFSLGIL